MACNQKNRLIYCIGKKSLRTEEEHMDEKKVKVSDEAKKEAAKRAAAAKAAAGKKTATKEKTEKKTAPKKTAPKKKAPTREAEEDIEEVEEEIEEEKPAKKRLEKKVSSEERSTVKKLRTWAIILWVVAVLAEVAAFFAFGWAVRNNVSAAAYPNALDRIGAFLNNAGVTPEILLTLLALVVDAAACIVAAQLWKKSNRISPCLADSALVRTLWHQLGVIMVLVCFVPIGIFLLLKSKGLNKKSRTVLLAGALALFLGATASSVDYKQPSKEEVEQLQQEAIAANADAEVYWTRYGKSYHFDLECQSIKGKELVEDGGTLNMGSLDEAFEANRWDPCDFCAGGGEVIEE